MTSSASRLARPPLSLPWLLAVLVALGVGCSEKNQPVRGDTARASETEQESPARVDAERPNPDSAPEVHGERHAPDARGTVEEVRAEPERPPVVHLKRPLEPALQKAISCLEEAHEAVSGPYWPTRLAIELGRLLASRDSLAAGRWLRNLTVTPELVAPLVEALVTLVQADPAVVKELLPLVSPAETRREVVRRLAMKVAATDSELALELVGVLTSRIRRELVLAELVKTLALTLPQQSRKLAAGIIEPILNDYAMVQVVGALFREAPAEAEALLEAIEAPMMQDWARHRLGLMRLADGQGELFPEQPPAAVLRDDVYAHAAAALVERNADKALAMALRIGDERTRREALAALAHRLFGERPAYALHVLEKEAGVKVGPEELADLVMRGCAAAPGHVAELLDQVKDRLDERLWPLVLEGCCPVDPKAVRRQAGKVLPSPTPALRRCYLCGGLLADRTGVARELSGGPEHDAAWSCVAHLELAEGRPKEAWEAVVKVSNPLVRDEEVAAAALAAAARVEPEVALAWAQRIKDPYVRGRAYVALLQHQTGSAELLLESHEEIADPWRQEDLARLALPILGEVDPERAVRLAGTLSDPLEREQLLESVAAALVSQEEGRAEVLAAADPATRGLLCGALGRAVLVAGAPEEAAVSPPESP